MRHRLGIGIGLTTAVLLAAPAHAADVLKAPASQVPYVAAYSWSGPYVGVNGGWVRQQKDVSIYGLDALGQLAITNSVVPAALSTSDSGLMGGATLGYNWQFGNSIVVGTEFDFDFSSVKGGSTVTNPLIGPFSVTSTANAKLDWISTFRARVGYLVMPQLLLYATGGGAAGHVSSDFSAVLNGPFGSGFVTGSNSENRFGWTAGAGVEYAFASHWSVKGEYKYVDLGSISTVGNGQVIGFPVGFGTKQDFKMQTAVLGVNYKF